MSECHIFIIREDTKWEEYYGRAFHDLVTLSHEFCEMFHQEPSISFNHPRLVFWNNLGFLN